MRSMIDAYVDLELKRGELADVRGAPQITAIEIVLCEDGQTCMVYADLNPDPTGGCGIHAGFDLAGDMFERERLEEAFLKITKTLH